MAKLTRMISTGMTAIGIAFAAGSAAPAYAYDASGAGVVIAVEADNKARFKLDTAIGSCAAGTFLTMQESSNISADKVKNAQSVVLAAFLSGKELVVFLSQSGCSVEYIHIR